MSEVVRTNAETTLKGLYSRKPAIAEEARHQAEQMPADEFLRLLHLFEAGWAHPHVNLGGRILAAAFLVFLGGGTGWWIWTDPSAWIMGVPPLLLLLVCVFTGFFGREYYTKEDRERGESILRSVLKAMPSSSIAEAAARLLDKRQQEEIVNRAPYSYPTFAPTAHAALLRVLPTMETAGGWKPKGRQALFELMQDDTYEHKLASSILDAAARWKDVDALPQVMILAKREDRPIPLRRRANEVMTLLLAERQKRQLGEGLLRASEAPQGQQRQELLRPAGSSISAPSDQLLRPS